MKWSYKLTRISGTDVNIHLTFLLALAWVGLEWGAIGMLFMVSLFACVLMHEFGHVFAARAFGIRTPDITLYPIGGVARLERMPQSPKQELIVALAGPAVNIVIALFLFGLISAGTALGALGRSSASFLLVLAEVNIALVLFNLIPAFPMDGGRVLRAILAMWMNRSKATDIAAKVGKVFAILFGVYGLFNNPMLIIIAIFVYRSAAQEAAFVRMQERASDPLRGPSGRTSASTSPMNRGRVPVIDDYGNVVGWVDQ